jgi:hypothetical protein
MKAPFRTLKFFCKKCKTKESVKYTSTYFGDDVEIEIHPCEVCGNQYKFSDIIKYL